MKFGSETPTPITSTFTFSPVNLTTLGATEYTLVSVTADRSGSVRDFAREMEKALKEIVSACRKSPRADNLLLRLTRFDHQIEEIHGFRQLADCTTDAYDGILEARGTTSLYDAALNSVEAVAGQGAKLIAEEYSANAIVFVITDGLDYCGSTATPSEVKKAIQRAMKAECLESIVTVLIGVNVQESSVADALKRFSTEAGFTQYVEHDRIAMDSDGWCARMFPERIYEAPRSTGRLMPPTDLRPSWLAGFQKGERLIFGPMLHASDRPFFLLIARGVNRRYSRLQIDQICGRMMPEVRR